MLSNPDPRTHGLIERLNFLTWTTWCQRPLAQLARLTPSSVEARMASWDQHIDEGARQKPADWPIEILLYELSRELNGDI